MAKEPDPKARNPRAEPDLLSLRLAQLIRDRREELGLTIYELAEQAGISPSFVSLIENGKKAPDLATVQRIASVLRLRDLLAEALQSWAVLRRPTDTVSSLGAARTLRSALAELDIDHPELSHQPLLFGEVESLARSRARRAARVPRHSVHDARHVPIVPEGVEAPEDVGEGWDDWLWIDQKILVPGERLGRPFAWRVSHNGIRRVPDLLRAGDFVVIVRKKPSLRSPRFAPDDIWVVRHRSVLVLSRVTLKGDSIILIPPPDGGADYELIDFDKKKDIREHFVGKVLVTVRRWGDRWEGHE